LKQPATALATFRDAPTSSVQSNCKSRHKCLFVFSKTRIHHGRSRDVSLLALPRSGDGHGVLAPLAESEPAGNRFEVSEQSCADHLMRLLADRNFYHNQSTVACEFARSSRFNWDLIGLAAGVSASLRLSRSDRSDTAAKFNAVR
jgi:hypothetical protein